MSVGGLRVRWWRPSWLAFAAVALAASPLAGCPDDITAPSAFAEPDASDTSHDLQPEATLDTPRRTGTDTSASADAAPELADATVPDTSPCPPLQPCLDTNPCTDDLCDPTSGCVHVANQDPCNDGNACTTGDHCAALACTATATTDCGDGNPCTDDLCDQAKGCVSIPSAPTPCSDGSVCTEGDTCGGGTCKSGAQKACDDGNPCTADSCDAAIGCTTTEVTGSCDDGLACTTDDVCTSSKCGGKPALFAVTVGAPAQVENAYRVLPDPKGYRVFVRAPYQPGLGFGKDDVWLHRFDTAGQALGKTTFGTAGIDTPFDATELSDGGCLVGGQVDNGGLNVLDALLVRVDAQGKAVWTKTYGAEPTTETAYALALAGANVTLAGTNTALPSGKDTWFARTDLDGKLLWTAAHDHGQDETATAVATVAGGFMAAGWQTMNQGLWVAGFVARYDDAGAELWHMPLGKQGDTSRFKALVKLPGGEFLAVGTHTVAFTLVVEDWLARVTPTGKVVWQTTYGKAGLTLGLSAATADETGVWVTGTALSGASQAAIRVVRVDGGGAYVWERTLASLDSDSVNGIRLIAGRLALAGFRKVQSKPSDALFRVVDAWGHASCSEAGACAAVAACPPSAPCKVAYCEAKTGCVVSSDSGCP